MASDPRHSSALTVTERNGGGQSFVGTERKPNGDDYHITVPPSMKRDIVEQRSILEEEETSQRLRNLTFPSPMEHLQEENRRLQLQIDELTKGDSSGMAAKVMQFMKDLRVEKDKVINAEKAIRKLESELSRARASGANVASSDHQYERMRSDFMVWKNKAEELELLKVNMDQEIERQRDQVQQWRSEAERWKKEAGQRKGSQDQEYKRLMDELQEWKTEVCRLKAVDEQRQQCSNVAPPNVPPRDPEPRLQNEIKQLKEELASVTRMKNELAQANRDWDSQYIKMKRGYEAQIKQLQESLRDIQGQLVKAIDNVNQDKISHEHGVRKLNDDLSTARQRAEESTRKLQSLEADYDRLRREYDVVNDKWSHSSTLLAEEQRRSDDLRRQVEQLQGCVGRQRGSQPEEVELLKRQNELFRDDFEHEKRDRVRLEREVAELRKMRDQEVNRGGYQQQDDQRRQIAIYKDSLEREKHSKLQLEREIEDLKKTLRDQGRNRAGYEYQDDQLRDLQRQLEYHRDELVYEKEEKQKLLREVTLLRQEIRSQESRLPNQSDELQAFRAQTALFQDDYEHEKEEKQHLMTQLSEKQRAMRSLETTNAALQQQIVQCEEDFQRERQDKEDYLKALRRERSNSSAQHQLAGTPDPPTVFTDEQIREQQQAWDRVERRRRDSEMIPQEVNAEPNLIGGVPQ